jgi:hypothetical protein
MFFNGSCLMMPSRMLSLLVMMTVLQVVDRTWEHIRLSEKTSIDCADDPDYVAELQKWTYGMLQGRELTFPVGRERPCKRCVIFMGQLMVDFARERNVLSPAVKLEHLSADTMTDFPGKKAVVAWLGTAVDLAAVRSELEEELDEEVEDIQED